MVQIVDSNNTLRNIYESNCSALEKSLQNYSWDFMRGLMTVYFSSTVNPESATYATAVHNVNEMKFLKDSYCIVMFDGRHQRLSV